MYCMYTIRLTPGTFSALDVDADTSGISLSILAVIIACAAVAFIAVLVGCFGIIAALIYCGFKKRRNANVNRENHNSVNEYHCEYAGACAK